MVAILLFTTAIQVKTDFTADRNVLDGHHQGPADRRCGGDGRRCADTGDDNGEDTGAAFVADETEFNIFNTDRKLAAIEKAVRKLAALPEKKALVYFTGGISKTGMENQAQLEASINAAVKANVAIYPIDARGLMARPSGRRRQQGAPRAVRAFSTAAVLNSQRASDQRFAGDAGDAGGRYRRQGRSWTATI